MASIVQAMTLLHAENASNILYEVQVPTRIPEALRRPTKAQSASDVVNPTAANIRPALALSAFGR
jgi:hypothetical protein